MEECEREVARTRRAVERGAPAVALCRTVARRLEIPPEEFMLLVANYGDWRSAGGLELLEAVYEGARELLPRAQILSLEGADSRALTARAGERREERERLRGELRGYGASADGDERTLEELRSMVRREKEREMTPLIVDALALLCRRCGLRVGALRRQILRAAVLTVMRWSWLGPELLLAGVTALQEGEE